MEPENSKLRGVARAENSRARLSFFGIERVRQENPSVRLVTVARSTSAAPLTVVDVHLTSMFGSLR